MRMLSVANVASLLGGTGRACLDCVRALPDWAHCVAFRGRTNPKHAEEIRTAFAPAGVIFSAQGQIAQIAAEYRPGVILHHNTPSPDMLPKSPAKRVFYQHSRHSVSERFYDYRFWVSQGLARASTAEDGVIVHQPVETPPGGPRVAPGGDNQWLATIGKLCTPTPNKWPDHTIDLYRGLIPLFPGVRWAFVGAPKHVQAALTAEYRDRVVFHPAGMDAQRLLWGWDALMHMGPWESYGRVVCEAQQTGCLPIVQAHGGVSEQIDDRKTGWLIRSANGIRDWSAAVAEFCDLVQGDRAELARRAMDAETAGRERGSLPGWAARFKEILGVD